MTKLRDYQQRAIAQIEAAFDSGAQGVVLESPCGAGKTVMAAEHIRRHNDDKVVCVVPRVELARQMADKVRTACNEEPGIIAGGFEATPGARIQIATIQSLLARDVSLKPDRIVFDECHHYEAKEWRKVTEAQPQAKRLGLSATPQRWDGLGLERTFDVSVRAASYSELIRDGWLVPARLYRAARRPEGLAMDPVDAYHLAEGSPTIVTVGRVEEAEAVASDFALRLGIDARVVDWSMPQRERKAVLRDFAAGRVRVLANVYILTEGLDVPEVRCMILARRFAWVGNYVQTVGRALRPAPGKRDAIIVDLTNASATHGPPDGNREWDMTHDPQLGRVGERNAEEEAAAGDPYYLPVTGEGVVRIQHGALSPSDPDPQPIPAREVKQSLLKRRALERIDAKAREMRRRGKPRAFVEQWREAELRRALGSAKAA